jgi:hypothetical protein
MLTALGAANKFQSSGYLEAPCPPTAAGLLLIKYGKKAASKMGKKSFSCDADGGTYTYVPAAPADSPITAYLSSRGYWH